ncbi:sodium:calcium antiporter [Microbulbifer sp. YPW16]|uniref:sodium:calcium antiporter n=1 Tax=Microbulbifer sp. YPW16 TaxID=2904242 RepID=UPI002105C1D6|nr:hypothetical protein [Microbulbifer sp. YPW16]
MTLDPANWSLTTSIILLCTAATVIGVCGVKLTHRAEILAQCTGMGQAIMGTLFLGMITSVAGVITSINAAWQGAGELAVSNAIGGIAAQTTFLVFADIVYRRANLEHAAASEQNLFQTVLVMLMLGLAILASAGPGYTIGHVDLFSPLLLAAYIGGVRLLSAAGDYPMWQPRQTALTQREPTERESAPVDLRQLWLTFAALAMVVAAAGWVTSHAGIVIARESGLSQTIVGSLFTAVATSLPELVIALTAARRGAVTLAVGNIIGGNSFDVLFLVGSDIAFRQGSIYTTINQQQTFWLAMNIVLSAIIMMGLLRRQAHGSGNIGFEGIAVLACYFSGVALLFWGG